MHTTTAEYKVVDGAYALQSKDMYVYILYINIPHRYRANYIMSLNCYYLL